MNITILASFSVILSLFVLSGAFAWFRKKRSPDDYLIASRKQPPWLSALSAVSTNNSGFMFIAMIGFTYRQGFEAIWLIIGWVLGDLTIWLTVYAKVRYLSEKEDVNTLPALLETQMEDGSRIIAMCAGMIIFIFLSTYAGAQLKASGIALNALFDWDMSVGILIGTVIVILYSFAGGIRADIWTDAAQSLVMLMTMILILYVCVVNVGGFQVMQEELRLQDAQLINWFPKDLSFGLPFYLLSLFFNGLGISGQPHVLTRFFAVKSVEAIPRTGFWYFSWYIPFAIASLAVGLYTRVIIPDLASLPITQSINEPTELALPLITMKLLPNVFVGVSLAGLFAATISTADSQIIVCSGALTQDLFPRWESSYLASKIATFLVTGLSLSMALFAPEGVFGLVLVAWSAMGASLGTLLVLKVFNFRLSLSCTLTMMLVSITTVTLWHLSPYNNEIYEMLPGAVSALFVYCLYQLIWLLKNQKD